MADVPSVRVGPGLTVRAAGEHLRYPREHLTDRSVKTEACWPVAKVRDECGKRRNPSEGPTIKELRRGSLCRHAFDHPELPPTPR
jgi:hypothetical protein